MNTSSFRHFSGHVSCMHLLQGLLIPLCHAHSWLVLIGADGLQRGGLNGTDLTRQRYYCPYTDFSKCKPANSNITLPADSNMPCRPGISNPMAKVSAGSSLALSWGGNGHIFQGNGTCVDIMIAPYANNPSLGSFSPLVNCVAFAPDATPGTTAIIPNTTAPGIYTLFWLWDFGQLFYSSCADINVTAPPTAPAGSILMTVAQALLLPYNKVDCALINGWDGYCAAAVGAGSYCEYWIKDTCGMSHCHGLATNITCAVSTPSGAMPPPLSSVTLSPELLGLPYNTTDCRNVTDPDIWCQAIVSAGSYCKNWSFDNCGRSHCFGRDVGFVENCTGSVVPPPLSNAGLPDPGEFTVISGKGCESSTNPDAYCVQEFGVGSYCKTYMVDHCGRSVCHWQGSLSPCPN